MPRAHSWRGRTGEIVSALELMEIPALSRSDIEILFRVQRRAALRLMEAVGPAESYGEWKVDRGRLLKWLSTFLCEELDRSARSHRVKGALRKVEDENHRLRAELRRLERPDPVAWTILPEVLSARMKSLPEGIQVSPGLVSILFSPEDPVEGARKLHTLSLAMLNDWDGFRRLAGDTTAEDEIGALTRELEAMKLQGVESSR